MSVTLQRCTALRAVAYNGGYFAQGESVDMLPADASNYTALGLVQVIDSNEETLAQTPVDLTGDVASLMQLWQQTITPEDYLSQFPTGPDSDLALRIIEAKQAAGDQL